MNPKERVKTLAQLNQELCEEGCRYILKAKRKKNKKTGETFSSPSLFVQDRTGTRRTWSLDPLQLGNWEDRKAVFLFIKLLKNQDWPFEHLDLESLSQEGRGYIERFGEERLDEEAQVKLTWDEVREICEKEWCLKMTKSSIRNPRSFLNQLVDQRIPMRWESMKKVAASKKLGSSSCRNFLEFLVHMNQALKSSDALRREPKWLKYVDIAQLRKLHNETKQSGYSLSGESWSEGGQADIRGFAEKEVAEKYFDRLLELGLDLEQFYLCMMLLYGLRNNEVYHISDPENGSPWEGISEANEKEGIKAGWIYVPGIWRTKSKAFHVVWPLYPEWIERYSLRERFTECQSILKRAERPKMYKPEIVGTKGKNKGLPYKKSWSRTYKDRGRCINNSELGSWITTQMRSVCPPWLGRLPDKYGCLSMRDEPKQMVPYDLRHSWAITNAIDERFTNVTLEAAAAAMGHGIEVHRRNYLRWVSDEDSIKRSMAVVNY